MANQQLVDWIKGEEAKGSSQKVITDTLAKQGWAMNDINDAMSSLHPRQAQPAQAAEWGEEKPKKQSMLPVIIIGIVCFILLLAAIIYKWFNP